MSVQDLARMDWGSHVPSQEGKLEGDDITNLSQIVGRIKEFDPKSKGVLENKCWRFATLQLDGAETVRIGRILKAGFGDAEQKFVAFNDGEALVNIYELAALKKDYPHFKESDLSKISAENFQGLIEILYPKGELAKTDKVDFDALKNVLDILEINDPALQFQLTNIADDVEKLTDEQLLKFVKVLVYKINSKEEISEKVRHLDFDAKSLIDHLAWRIALLNPDNKKSVILMAKLHKEVSDIKDDKQKKNFQGIKSNINTSAVSATKRNFVTKLLESIAKALHHSFAYWFDADQDFALEVLRDIPDFKLFIYKELPDSYLDKLSSMENITLSGSRYLSDDYKKHLRKNYPDISIESKVNPIPY